MTRRTGHHNLELLFSQALAPWKLLSRQIHELSTDLSRALSLESLDERIPSFSERLRDFDRTLQEFEASAKKPRVVLATTGTTSSGKSTLANYLIGEALLPKAVQEMSAGLVEVRHGNENSLTIQPTAGATWETGTWGNLTAAQVEQHLRTVMYQYRELLDASDPVDDSNIEAPRFLIHWPTQIGNHPEKFGLPKGSQLTILDLPGLKSMEDPVNGPVIQSHVKKALCLVTYNAMETDRAKQGYLLNEVARQVATLGGSPSRMLFILNRIDVFRTDVNPEASEIAFTKEITRQIRAKVRDELSEYANEAEAIEAIPLSAEPALYALLAKLGPDHEQAGQLKRIERDYRALFSPDALEDLHRNPERWSVAERQWFIDEARIQSRAHNFDEILSTHISSNLPEILLPELISNTYEAARGILLDFSALVSAYKKTEETQLDEEERRLGGAYDELIAVKDQSLELLAPIRKESFGDGDFLSMLEAAVTQVEAALNLEGPSKTEGRLSALHNSLAAATQVPIYRVALEYIVPILEGKTPDASIVQSCESGPALLKATEALRDSPYGTVWDKGGKFKENDAKVVEEQLERFVQTLSKTSSEMVRIAAQTQSHRIKDALDLCTSEIINKIESNAKMIRDKHDLGGLSGVFRGDFRLSPPNLGTIRFDSNIKRWSFHGYREEKKEHTFKKRFLLIFKRSYTEIRTEYIPFEEDGINAPGFNQLIQSFEERGDRASMETAWLHWLVESIDRFDEKLTERATIGINNYIQRIAERKEELKRGTLLRIEGAEMVDASIRQALQNANDSQDWRAIVALH